MKKILSILCLIFAVIFTANADELNREQKALQKEIFKYLKENGYTPTIDDDGDIKFNYDNLYHYIVIYESDLSPMYVTMYLPYTYGTTYTKEFVKRNINEIGYYKGIKIVTLDESYWFLAEMYLTKAETFNTAFNQLLKNIHSAKNELSNLTTSTESTETTGTTTNSTASYLKVNQQTTVSTTYGSEAGSEVFQVSTDASEWRTWGIPTWCSVVDITATSFRLKYEANTSGLSRSDYMKILAGDKEVRINIRQEATESNTVNASIQDITVQHNVTQHGQKGMYIFLDFNINNMLKRTGKCVAYFYSTDGSYALRDVNNKYATVSGKVCCTKEFTPPYKSCEYTDTKLFMPYNELHMGSGTHNLKLFISIFDDKGNEIIQSDWVDFTYTY